MTDSDLLYLECDLGRGYVATSRDEDAIRILEKVVGAWQRIQDEEDRDRPVYHAFVLQVGEAAEDVPGR